MKRALSDNDLEDPQDYSGESSSEKISDNIPMLTTTSIMTLLTPEQQMDLLAHLEEVGANRTDSIQSKISEMSEKYYKLVAAARSTGGAFVDEVANEFPGEWNDYLRDNTNFEHGFNSGCLAMARFLYSYALPYNHRIIYEDSEPYPPLVMTRKKEIVQAEDEFPMLDT